VLNWAQSGEGNAFNVAGSYSGQLVYPEFRQTQLLQGL